MPYNTIGIDATSSKSWSTTKTWNHTVGTAADRMLIVCIGLRNDTTTGVTYGGVALTNVIRSDTYDASIWVLPSPASGTAQIAITTNGTESLAAGAVSIYNAAQSAYKDDSDEDVNAGSGTVTNTLTAAIANGIAVQAVIHQSTNEGTFGSGQTSLVNSAGADGGAASYKTYSSIGNVTMSYTVSDTSVQVVALIKPSGYRTISTSDSITVSENVGVHQDRTFNVSEDVTLTESVSALKESFINVNDSVTLTENYDETIRDGLQISIWKEVVTVTDTPEFPGPRDRFVTEDISVSEKVTVKIVNETFYGDKPRAKVEYL